MILLEMLKIDKYLFALENISCPEYFSFHLHVALADTNDDILWSQNKALKED